MMRYSLAAVVALALGPAGAKRLAAPKRRSMRLAADKEDPCACQPNGLEKISGATLDAPGTKSYESYVARRDSKGKVVEYLPGDYGESCKNWDGAHEACKQEYAPAWCAAKWCYVKKECAAVKDSKLSLYFPGKKLYYSYNNCGSMDSFTSEACFSKDEASCTDPCSFNKVTGTCQNKLCMCTGDNTATKNQEKYEKNILSVYGDNYGEQCHSWDEKSCPVWAKLSKEEGGAELGLWCCKDWCYVSEECPSAEQGAYGQFYSYYACPDDTESLTSCPWKQPITYEGEPLPLTAAGAKALNEHAARPRSFSARTSVALGASLAAFFLVVASA